MKKDNKKEKISLKGKLHRQINKWFTESRLTILCISMFAFSIFLICLYEYTKIYSINILSSIIIGLAIMLFPKISDQTKKEICKQSILILIFIFLAIFPISYWITIIKLKISIWLADIIFSVWSVAIITYFFNLFKKIYVFTAKKIKDLNTPIKSACKKIGILFGTLGGALTCIVTLINNGDKIADSVIKIIDSL